MVQQELEKIIQHVRDDMRTIRAGRANPEMLEDLTVQAYGSQMRLQELAAITAPESQLLVVQPWDVTQTQAIESAIRNSQLQLNPVVDGVIIRIAFPPLTEDKRKEMVKLVHQKAEENRIAVRKVREEFLKELKRQKQEGDLSEDDYFAQEKKIQAEVDNANNSIKEIVESKESELMSL